MSKKKKMLGWAGLVAFMAILTSCFYETLSWSPDGRYLAFAAGDAGKLLRWDSQTETMEEIKVVSGVPAIDVSDSVKSCAYLPSGEAIAIQTENHERVGLYEMNVNSPDKRCSVIAEGEGVMQAFDVSRQGSIYYVKEDYKKHECALWEYKNGHNKLIWTSKHEIGFPRIDPAGKRVLVASEHTLCLLDLDHLTTRTLVTLARPGQDDKENNARWSLWLNEHSVLYLAEVKEQGVGELMRLDVDDRTTRSLMKEVNTYVPPSLSPDLKHVAVIAAWRDAQGKIDKELPAQVAEVDLASGKWEWLTDEPFGASMPAYAPTGGRLAYLAATAQDGGPSLLKILDLKTKREKIAWRNDEERLYAAAMSLTRAGEPVQGAMQLKDLLDRFPNTAYKPLVVYQGIRLITQPPHTNLDLAYDLLKQVSTPGDLLGQRLRDAFWRPEDRLATDPAEDWVSTYATEASKKEAKFNTDLTRDLRAVWVRVGAARVYIRVDYGNDRDLSGITFQDTQLLFDYDDPAKGERRISPGAEWDRGAKRQVLVRHWFEAAEKSQYDLEIKGENGEVIARYLASGFAPPTNPLFAVAALYKGATGSVVFALDRKMLGLEPGQGSQPSRKVNLQVCTYKGGIDRGERPRQSAGCDVADAFGADNTAGRMRAEMKAVGAAGAKPFTIRGAAGSFVVTDK